MSQHINNFAKTLRDSNSQKNNQPVRQNKMAKAGPSTANGRIAKKHTLKAVKAGVNAAVPNRVAPTTRLYTASNANTRTASTARVRDATTTTSHTATRTRTASAKTHAAAPANAHTRTATNTRNPVNTSSAVPSNTRNAASSNTRSAAGTNVRSAAATNARSAAPSNTRSVASFNTRSATATNARNAVVNTQTAAVANTRAANNARNVAIPRTSPVNATCSSHKSTVGTPNTAKPTVAVRSTNTSTIRAANAFTTQAAKSSANKATALTRAIHNKVTHIAPNITGSGISKPADAKVGADIRPLKKVKKSISLKKAGSNIATSEVSVPSLEAKAHLYETEANNRQTLSSIDVAKHSFDLTKLESLQEEGEQAPVNLKRKLNQIESTANQQEATTSTSASPYPASSYPLSPAPVSPAPVSPSSTQASPIPALPPLMFTPSYRIKSLFSSGNLRDTSDEEVIIPAQSHQNEKAELTSTSLFASTSGVTTKPGSDTENDCTNQEDLNPISQTRYKRYTDLLFYLNNLPLDTTIEDILDDDIFPDLLVPRNPKLCEREVGDLTEDAYFSWSKEPQLTEQLRLQEDFKDDIKNYFNRTKFSQEEVFKEHE